MTQPFTPKQSEEIDDRIVEMIVAVLGEGDAARRCRVIANERYLNSFPEIPDPAPASSEDGAPQSSAPVMDGRDDDNTPGNAAAAHVRLGCLKLAIEMCGRNPQQAIDLAAMLEHQVLNGFATSFPPELAPGTPRRSNGSPDA